MKPAILAAAAMTLAACASSPGDITAQHVSTAQYQGLTCQQAAVEAQRINARLEYITSVQQDKATSDAAMMAVGMLIAWPALFFIGHGEDHADEIGRLRGEAHAIAARQRGC